MGILANLRQSREIKRLRRQVLAAPSPTSFCELAERCIALDRMDMALATASEALKRFPGSERLSSIVSFARRYLLKAKIGRLRRSISEKPNPRALGRLAEIYLEIGDQDQALRICEEYVQRFPLNERPYMVIGRIRLERFFRERISVDGLEAERQLQRVISLNGRNTDALVLLAHLYHAVGAMEAMRELLRTALEIEPRRSEVREFLESVDARSSAPTEVEDAERDLPPSERIRSVEAEGAFPNPPPAFRPNLLGDPGQEDEESSILSDVTLEEALKDVAEVPGVKEAAFLDGSGQLLAGYGEEESGGGLPDLAAEVLQTAEEAGRHMDLGSFQWCTVEGSFGGVTITRIRDVHLAASYGPPLKPDQAPRALESSADRIFAAPGEVEGA